MTSRPHPLSENVPGPESLIGSFRRFGPFGPVYQVIEKLRDEDDDIIMKVRVVDTGEEAEYRYTHILDDPKEK
ncbi:MAG: DUF5397 family protein [Proteobacteria bacterium]|nr:DUF5397 family protein [Pseudomonadota bacterium]MCH7956258.1 DUF5397 family protein [Pseudomonadota bacterium]MCH8214137.1 DUF5397 family protein [Pseudomonadota bacterium]